MTQSRKQKRPLTFNEMEWGDQEDKLLPDSVLSDALQNGIYTLNLVDVNQGNTLAVFDHILEKSIQDKTDWLSTATEEGLDQITAPILAIRISQLLFNWMIGQEQAAKILSFTPAFLDDMKLDQSEFESRLVTLVIHAYEPIGSLQLSREYGVEKLVTEASVAFRELADLLEQNGYEREAFNIATVASNVTEVTRHPDALLCMQRAVQLSLKLQDRDDIGLSMARLALRISHVAGQGKVSHVQAFDAIEKALLHLPEDPDKRKQALSWLGRLVQQEKYQGLFPFYLLSLPESERPPLPEEALQASVWLQRVSSMERNAWLSLLVGDTRTLITEIENRRLALQPRNTTPNNRASWSSWTFDLDSFRQAIPDGPSLLREDKLNQILLDLNHEITHVFSMLSGAGLAMVALRLTSLEMELRLWTYLSSGVEDFASDFLEKGIAPLEGVSWTALPQVEQALEISRKIQILQESLEPWFEGIAIFSELSTDPAADPDVWSPAMGVITNLVDNVISSDLSLEERSQQSLELIQNLEKLYSDIVLGDDAYFSLRTFLVPYFEHYLAGYLLVRSIVSSWRITLGYPLSGAVAARTLLYVTRYGTLDLIPDLGLPLDEFRTLVLQNTISWFQILSSLNKAELEYLITSDAAKELSHSPLKSLNFEQYSDSSLIEERLAELMSQAFSSLCGKNSSGTRVPDAGEWCQEQLKQSATILSGLEQVFSNNNELLENYMIAQNIFPIGRIECPFWINREASLLFCLIRTTETRKDSLEPSYNGLVLPLTPEDLEKLEEMIKLHGVSRMTITRVADAMLTDKYPGRLGGRNYYVFQYVDWLFVQSRGLYFGHEVPPTLKYDVQVSFIPNPLKKIDSQIVSTGIAGAERSQQWLTSLIEPRAPSDLLNLWFDKDDPEDLDSWAEQKVLENLEPWINYTIDLCQQILHPTRRKERAEMTKSILQFVFDDNALVIDLEKNGLKAICGDNAETLKTLLKHIQKTAFNPLSEIEPEMMSLRGTPLIKSDLGWDFTPPKGTKPVDPFSHEQRK